jgi:hypothetical protein
MLKLQYHQEIVEPEPKLRSYAQYYKNAMEALEFGEACNGVKGLWPLHDHRRCVCGSLKF